MIHYKFSKHVNKEFAQTLRGRINDYFNENKISKNANSQMVGKSVFVLSLYLMPLIIMLITNISSIGILFGLWVIMGIGKAFVGTAVMHDALHGSYSKKKSINLLMGFSAFVVGANPKIWQIQHNVLHHTYTNIEHADEDIVTPSYLLRFTPNQPHKWYHKYQHIYAAFFYGISTLTWITIKDFIKVFEYRGEGLIKSKNDFNKTFTIIIIQKILYLGLFLVLPMLVLPVSPWLVVAMFVTMHFVTGLLLTLIFQTAHVMPTSEFLMQEEEEIEENWWVHQLHTTTNYATSSRFFSWMIGGLNFQIEHHLFPNICHVHYPKIASIVKNTAAEFNLPYYVQRSFRSAVMQHFSLLRKLGRGANFKMV
jgi:linoleoyl-CoA desaturase